MTLLKLALIIGLVGTMLNCDSAAGKTSFNNQNSAQDKASQKRTISEYQTTSSIQWEFGNESTIEARMETLKTACGDVPCRSAPSRLIVSNLNMNKIIYQSDEWDNPRSFCVQNPGQLVVYWGGGSADRIEILEVNSKNAHVVLDERYRFSAFVGAITNDDEVSVFITTAEGGGMPEKTTRYIWKGDKYVPAGTVSFDRLSKEITTLFQKK